MLPVRPARQDEHHQSYDAKQARSHMRPDANHGRDRERYTWLTAYGPATVQWALNIVMDCTAMR